MAAVSNMKIHPRPYTGGAMPYGTQHLRDLKSPLDRVARCFSLFWQCQRRPSYYEDLGPSMQLIQPLQLILGAFHLGVVV